MALVPNSEFVDVNLLQLFFARWGNGFKWKDDLVSTPTKKYSGKLRPPDLDSSRVLHLITDHIETPPGHISLTTKKWWAQKSNTGKKNECVVSSQNQWLVFLRFTFLRFYIFTFLLLLLLLLNNCVHWWPKQFFNESLCIFKSSNHM